MFNIAKITKDIESIADVVLMGEIRDTEQALTILQKKLQLLYAERDKRIGEQRKVEPVPPFVPSPAGNMEEKKTMTPAAATAKGKRK